MWDISPCQLVTHKVLNDAMPVPNIPDAETQYDLGDLEISVTRGFGTQYDPEALFPSRLKGIVTEPVGSNKLTVLCFICIN